MNRTISLSLLVALVAVSPAFAEITVVNSVGFGTATGSTGGSRTVSAGELGTFTANGADKLVVTIGGEGINNAASGTGNSPTVLSVTYGGVPMVKVFDRYINNRGNSMWYLDNVAVTGDFVITYQGESDDLGFAAYALSGTLEGTAEVTGSVTGHAANSPTQVPLNILTDGSFVAASFARNNSDGTNESIPPPNTGVLPPLTPLFHTALSGTYSGSSTAAGYANNVSAGTFNAQIEELTNNAGSLIAAGFPPAPASPLDFQLVIRPAEGNPGNYDFEWGSRSDKVYDLVSAADLSSSPEAWPVWNGQADLAANPPTNTLANIPGGGDARRFFAVVERDAPPPPVESELSGVWGSGTTVTLSFTEELDEALATDPFNYQVFNLDVFWPILSAVLSPDGKTVTLTLETPLSADATFSVSLSNLTSIDGTPLVGNTTAQFQTWDDDPNGIKVFILAGQSNMVGYGRSEIGNGGVVGAIGSLRHLAVNNELFPEYDYTSLLVNPADPVNSAWRTRGDVKVWWRDGGTNLGGTVRKGDLGPPFMGSITTNYGPEYAFGQVLGDHYAGDDVLIIKAAWGGKSLAVDFRPPSAVARVPATQIGPFYQGMIDNVRDVLDNLGTEFPQWSGTGYQIVGFGWHQGWNDRGAQAYVDEYEANMADFISDVRTRLGKPVLPFVIATTGMTGPTETGTLALSLMDAQLAMQDFTKYPAHEGNVAVRDTREFWRDASVSPVDQGFHWNQNGETQFLIGKSMGDLMVDLLTP